MFSTRGGWGVRFRAAPIRTMITMRSIFAVNSAHDTRVTRTSGADLPSYCQAREQATANEQASRLAVPTSLVGYGPS